jgi:putative ABC transport system permease protein
VVNQFLQLWRRLLFYLRREQFDRELEEEMKFHLEMKAEENLAAGMSPQEARYVAQRQFGNQTLLQEVSREMWGVRSIETLFQDLSYGVRMLLKHKGFTAVAVFSLALGIGANTAIFSLINALMLRMLPVKDAQELVLFSITGPNMSQGGGFSFNYPLYEMFRDRNQSFAGIIAGSGVGRSRLQVSEPGAVAESVQQQSVSGNYFSVLGINPALGRALTETDYNPANTQPAGVISYEFWQRRFDGDPNVIGRQVVVGSTSLIIVGIMSPGFFGTEVGSKPELWWPIKAIDDGDWRRNQAWWISVFGRLRPGVSVTQAQAEMESIFRQQLNEIAAERSANWTPTRRQQHFDRHIGLVAGSNGYTRLRQQFRQPLFILTATVGLVLLIACVNVANLLLVRAATRLKEIAMRLALGAGRFRLLRQLLTESVLLSMLGGAAGLLFAHVCLRLLITYLPQQAQTALDISLDARVLGFTLAVSVLTGLLFGLAPAWQATRLDLTAAIKDQSGASAGRARLMLNKLLVVTQVALSLFLLIGAGLFVRSLRNLRTLDVGINYENIVQFSIDMGSGYDFAKRSELYKQMLTRLEAIPGVRSATLSYITPLSGDTSSLTITVPGYTPAPDENTNCYVMEVGPRFFETMKMPTLAGRDFGPQDERPVPPGNAPAATASQNMAAAPPLSAVTNQTMARHFFGNENPVGKRFSLRGNGQSYEIIGVTKDAKYANLREQMPRTYYTYYFQQPQRNPRTLQLRTSGDSSGYATAIQRVVRELDPQAQVVGLRMMRDVVNDSLMQERFIAQTASAFSLFALLLACVGLYGVMSYAVTRRTSEIGIRMALGAQARDIVRLVMGEVLLLVTLGIGIGLAEALATTRLASTLFTLLFGLAPSDPLTITLATLLLIGVAALAGYLPAWRAARVDPLAALRNE